MAESDNLVSDINELINWEASVVGWGPTYLSFLGNLATWALWVPTAFAPAVHSHDGLGGEVMGIGTSDARPAVVNGYILSATDTEQIEMIDDSGNLIAAAAMQGKPLPLGVQASDPDTAANEIRIYAKDADGQAAFFMRQESNGPVIPISGVSLGYRSGCIVGYYDSTTLLVGGGEIEINGRSYLISSMLTKTLSGLSNSTWHYVFASAPASGRTLSASEITYSSTAPTVSHAKAAKYYNAAGTGRLIGAFRTDGSGNVEPFVAAADGWVERLTPLEFLGTSSPATSDYALSVIGPALGMISVRIDFRGYFANAVDYNGYMAPNGLGSLTSANIVIDVNNTGYITQRIDMTVGPEGKVSYKWDWPGGGSLSYKLAAFKLPL